MNTTPLLLKYGLTFHMYLCTNDSEKISPITLVKTSLKITRIPYDPLENFLQNGHFVPYGPYHCIQKRLVCTYWDPLDKQKRRVQIEYPSTYWDTNCNRNNSGVPGKGFLIMYKWPKILLKIGERKGTEPVPAFPESAFPFLRVPLIWVPVPFHFVKKWANEFIEPLNLSLIGRSWKNRRFIARGNCF